MLLNKAIGYIRVSTDKEKQANSLAAQPETIKAYAKMQGLDLIDVVADETSALKVPFFERPGGSRILALIKEKKVQHVIGAKVDRIFRNVQDGLETADWLKARGIELHVIDTGGILNVNDAAGRMMFSMLLAVAEFEPRRISQRTREALGVMRSAGKKVGTVPLGYREVDGQLVEVPEEMEIVNEILLRDGRGETMKGIATILNARMVPTKQGGTWHPSTIRAIVKRKSV
jgi:DNA invertase Pin-like site-specific DNA recombinase